MGVERRGASRERQRAARSRNADGVDISLGGAPRGRAGAPSRTFAELLQALDAIEGIERIRYTSPHPKDMKEDVIRAHADLPALCEQIHLPLQSGSSAVLKRMRRTYDRRRYMDRVALIREHVPDCAITTDIIVGFPGETEEDFQATLDVVRQARFTNAFTFQYSNRPGTPAADLPDQVDPTVVTERYQRLVALVNELSWAENQRFEGQVVELMVAEGEGKKDLETRRLSGRAPDNRLVHFTPVDADGAPVDLRPGDMVTVTVTYAAPHHLVADIVRAVRRTRAGDAWEARQHSSTAAPGGVLLGMPAVPAAR